MPLDELFAPSPEEVARLRAQRLRQGRGALGSERGSQADRLAGAVGRGVDAAQASPITSADAGDFGAYTQATRDQGGFNKTRGTDAAPSVSAADAGDFGAFSQNAARGDFKGTGQLPVAPPGVSALDSDTSAQMLAAGALGGEQDPSSPWNVPPGAPAQPNPLMASTGQPGAVAGYPQGAPYQGPVPGQQPKPALPKAKGAVVTNSTSASGTPKVPAADANAGAHPLQADPMTDLETSRAKLEKQLEELEKPVNYDALRQEALNRQEGSRNSLIMALAAQNAGKGFEPFQAQYLKKSAELGGPMQVEGGYINERGEAVIDPGYKRTQQMQFLQRRLTALDQTIANTQNKQAQMQLQRERMQTENMIKMMQLGIMQQGVDLKRAIAEGTGQLGGGGGPGGMDVLPKNATQKEKDHYGNVTEMANILPGLQQEVLRHPEAFGKQIGGAEAIGGWTGVGQQDVPLVGKKITDEAATVRGRVYTHYAQVLHDLIGTAQTESERTNLRSFIPAPGESAASVAQKMNSAIAYARASRSNLRGRYGMGSDEVNVPY